MSKLKMSDKTIQDFDEYKKLFADAEALRTELMMKAVEVAQYAISSKVNVIEDLGKRYMEKVTELAEFEMNFVLTDEASEEPVKAEDTKAIEIVLSSPELHAAFDQAKRLPNGEYTIYKAGWASPLHNHKPPGQEWHPEKIDGKWFWVLQEQEQEVT